MKEDDEALEGCLQFKKKITKLIGYLMCLKVLRVWDKLIIDTWMLRNMEKEAMANFGQKEMKSYYANLFNRE